LSFVLPAVVGGPAVRSFPFDFRRQAKEGFRDEKLCFNLLDADAMINYSQEAGIIGCFDELLGDIILSTFKVYVFMSILELFEYWSNWYLSER
jgi:hypothetical protein